jgi:hypothetical protein
MNYINKSTDYIKSIVRSSILKNADILRIVRTKYYSIFEEDRTIIDMCLETHDVIEKKEGKITPYYNRQEWCTFSPKIFLDYKSNKKKWIKEMLIRSLENINYKRPLTIKDLVVVDVLDVNGSYFGRFHTDTEWDLFPEADGFQIWYLVYNKEKNRYGNMFLHTNPKFDHTFSPASVKHKNGKIIIEDNDYSIKRRTTCDNFPLDKGKFTYLNIHDGDCLIMTKNVLHSSDLRLTKPENRLSINLRIVIRNEDGSINYKPSSRSRLYTLSHHTFKNGKLYNVKQFDMAGF